MTAPLPLRFVLSASGIAQLPPTPAEIALVGRSNVGKSSLINALAHRNNLAKVSGTPGRTQTLNFYELAGSGSVVDLPGYGYSAAGRQARALWTAMVPEYLLGRQELRSVIVLVDAAVGPTRLDVETLAWLADQGLESHVVATKWDKVKPAQRVRRRRDLAAGCGLAAEEVLWVSSASGTGIDALRSQVLAWLTGS